MVAIKNSSPDSSQLPELEDEATKEARNPFADLTKVHPEKDADHNVQDRPGSREANLAILKQIKKEELGSSGSNKKESNEKKSSLPSGIIAAGIAGGATIPKRLVGLIRRNPKKSAAGGIIGGGIIGTIIALNVLLPIMRIPLLIQQIDSLFGSGVSSAIRHVEEKSFNTWTKKYILPNLLAKSCSTSANIGCVSASKSKNIVSRMYNRWRENGFETKLAQQEGILFERRENTLSMYLGDKVVLDEAALKTIAAGDASIFEFVPQTTSGSLTDVKFLQEARHAVSSKITSRSFVLRTFRRYKALKLLQIKYGVRFCMLACKLTDPLHVSITSAKLAARSLIAELVAAPFGETSGTLLYCIINGNIGCSTDLKTIQTRPVGEQGQLLAGPESEATTSLERVFGRAADEATLKTLESVVSDADRLAKIGFTGFVLERALTPILGDIAAKRATDLVAPYVGWAMLIASFVVAMDTASTTIRYITYASSAAAAVHLYMMYATVASEQKSGHVNAAEIASFNDALATNVLGTAKDQVDASTTPLYNQLFGNGSEKTNYRCNDGTSVPVGQIVCSEEKIDQGFGPANFAHDLINRFPALLLLGRLINLGNNLVGWFTEHFFAVSCNIQDFVGLKLTNIASCTASQKALAPFASQLSSWLIGKLVPSPFSDNMSGGRTFDMIVAGADVAQNKTCHLALGCTRLTDQQVADMRAEEINNQKLEFEQRPILARMFSTDTPNSLFAQVALTMPTSIPQAIDRAASIFTRPSTVVMDWFSKLYPTNKIFAAGRPASDPFGVIQYGYLPNQIPDDPEAYWEQNCKGRDFALDWLNSQLTPDPNTGESVATKPEPCMLIQSFAQSAGGYYDPTMLPAGSTNDLQQ